MRSVKPFKSKETFKTGYYAYFNSIINYGLIWQGNSTKSAKVIKIKHIYN